MLISVIIPAYNEEKSIAFVVKDIPKNIVQEIVVVNNNSKDATAQVAKSAGATVLTETKQGYGAACLCGINYLKQQSIQPDIVVFMDADYSDYPEQIILLIDEIKKGKDLVIGSRALGNREAGAMLPQQRFGNWLATSLIKLLYKHTYTDLGPFRAIRWQTLMQINMQDQDYGWTVEMQIKALKHNCSVGEVAVDYKKRIGVSKIAGTLKGTILAGYKIITTIFKYK